VPRPPLTRREFLLAGAALLAGCDPRQPQRGALGTLDRFNGRAENALLGPARRAPTAAGRQLTPLGEFPRYKIGDDFPLPPPGFALEIGGLVARPLRLTLAQLLSLEKTEMRVEHHCVEGWSAVASWHGVRLSAIAELAQVDPRAKFVEFVSFELAPMAEEAPVGVEVVSHGPDAKANPAEMPRPRATTYSSSWDRASALHPQTLLAYGMNGAPLGREHGGPVRVYSAVKLGYKLVKWLAAVRFLPAPTGGYWEDQGYEWFAGV
jgi:DMSO/TMAO reductase YedYZ molybdopterin-dependent catalytic subunit